MVSVAGAQFSTALHTMREAEKLIRVASRATHCMTQGDKRSLVKPS